MKETREDFDCLIPLNIIYLLVSIMSDMIILYTFIRTIIFLYFIFYIYILYDLIPCFIYIINFIIKKIHML